jgi:hypothetical protein
MAASEGHGDRAEEAVREVAAVLGLPDLVYLAELSQHRSSGTREVGDGLLIANGRGAIIQVKARAGDGGPDDQDKAQRWIRKHLNRAIRQGRGSANTIELARERGEPIILTPVRCLKLDAEVRERFAVALDALDVQRWLQTWSSRLLRLMRSNLKYPTAPLSSAFVIGTSCTERSAL